MEEKAAGDNERFTNIILVFSIQDKMPTTQSKGAQGQPLLFYSIKISLGGRLIQLSIGP